MDSERRCRTASSHCLGNGMETCPGNLWRRLALSISDLRPNRRICSGSLRRVEVGNDVRRLMFTLAHAHGTALALVNIAAGVTARHFLNFDLRRSVSASLIWAGILFPIGFILGGVVTYGGDPGLGIWLVPLAA